jgi:hypothetical protein
LREEAVQRLNNTLGEVPPFNKYRDIWIHTGDGGYVMATARFGEWTIDRLVEKKSPDERTYLNDVAARPRRSRRSNAHR